MTRPLRFTASSFGVTIFLSAFLLFWVQLLLGKYILPWFGGAAAVWITCMLFFQILLLAGYAYAHWLNRLKSRTQTLLHCALLAGSIVVLACLALAWSSPITPGPSWKPPDADHPVFRIVTLLSVSVGLPFFVLSSTGPLLQSWYWRAVQKGSPYRLYSLSNLGSFLSLLVFPALFEPQLALRSQAWLWSCGYLAFALTCAYIAIRTDGGGVPENEATNVSHSGAAAQPSIRRHLLWGGLSACASILFLATTNQICQDIGVVPLLWIAPLGVYLLTFVMCFEHDGWYSRKWFHPAFAAAVWLACFVLYDGAVGSIIQQIAIYLVVLFVSCMVCNGELARAKPEPNLLTSFYLTVAFGGAIGGISVGLVAPHIFRGFWEYQLGLWMAAVLLLLILLREKESWLYQGKIASPVLVVALASLLPESGTITVTQTNQLTGHSTAIVALILVIYVFLNRNRATSSASCAARVKIAPIYCLVALILAAVTLGGTALAHVRADVQTSRSFYGVLSVRAQNMSDPALAAYSLLHGRVMHGFQFRAPDERRTPTAYFGPGSGVGLAVHQAETSSGSRTQAGLRIGVVGLGAGTVAAYGKAGDHVRFYEINPDDIRIASNAKYFTFLSDSPAQIDVIPGDGRLSLERELADGDPEDLDVLVIDAFSGDAIPVHLLTLEAFEIYRRRLKIPSGILAIHITNTYLDLRPVVFAAARKLGLPAVFVHSAGDGRVTIPTDWMLVSSGSNSLNVVSEGSADRQSFNDDPPPKTIAPWTDDYSNLIRIIRR